MPNTSSKRKQPLTKSSGVRERIAEVEETQSQRREQEEIQKSREYLQSILNNSLDLIFTIKSDGTFSFFNKSLEPMTGYKEEGTARATIHGLCGG